jgi:plastocyanin
MSSLIRLRSHAVPGLGLAAALWMSVAGCGKGEGPDDTVVIPEPGTNVTASAAPAAATNAAPEAAPAVGKGAATDTAPAKGTVTAEGWGTLKGRVVFGGNPPAPKVLVRQGDPNAKDAAICAANAITSQRLVVDPESKGVRYALVYIPKPTRVNDEAKSAASQATVEFDQQKCVFLPHVLPLMAGAAVTVKSSDQVTHNVNSKLVNTKFNSSVSPGNTIVVNAKNPERGPGEVVCDIHPWMKAWWLVIDSPYYAVTDEKGNFEIKNVPAGTQKVVVWQEAAGFVTPAAGAPLDIKADGEITKDFTVEPGKVKPEA